MGVRIVRSTDGKIGSHGIPEKITWSSCADAMSPAIFVSRRAITGAKERASEAFLHRKETMGLLIGHPFYDCGGLKLEIADSLPLPVDADAHHVAVDRHADELDWDETRGGSLVVGWYHSHTGQGNFLSETDRRTHNVWFNQPYAVAMLIEAAEGTIGVYSKRNGALTAVDYGVFEI